MTDTAGIPQSPALAEASPESLAELLSRDPEGYGRQDLDRVIAAMRQQRERQAAGAAQPKPPKGDKGLLGKIAASAEDVGL